MIRRPPRSTQSRSSAASDVYKRQVVCQNEICRYYLNEENKDIIKRGKYSTGNQRYFCHHCKTFFMETKGTPLYHKHLSKPEIINICKHLVEKNGIRSIERITGHHRDTIGNLIEDLASVSYTHLRAHETRHDLVCRLLLEKKKKKNIHT